MDLTKRPILIYDDKCAMCTRFKQALERMNGDHAIYFTPLHNTNVKDIHPGLILEDCLDYVHLVDDNNKIYKGSEVVEYLLTFYPQVSKLSWLVDSDTGKRAIKAFHDAAHKIKNSSFLGCSGCNKK